MSQSFWSLLQGQLQQQLDPEEYATWFRPLKVGDEDGAPAGAAGAELPLPPHPGGELPAGRWTGPSRVSAAQASRCCSPWRTSRPRLGRAADRALATSIPSTCSPSFVEGKSNEFALAAARRVAENPSFSYNPLFLYGGVGLGKTHLLHAIGHEIQRSRPQLRVLYLAAEQFVNELINSIRFDRMPAFRERYRTIDVLMIDDVQFLANKERTQEEFFHTFNTLYTSQKQIILSSDSSPRNIPTLEERLRSRFEWGLIADIQPPDLETKVAILQRKAACEGHRNSPRRSRSSSPSR